MFAYCGNCPVMYIDYSGMVRNSILGDNHISSDMFFMSNGRSGGGIEPSGRTAFAKAIENVIAFFSNEDPNAVLNTDWFAYYMGVPVVKLPIGVNAFSFGIIFLGDKVRDKNTVRHEYGHSVHLSQIGFVNYTTKVFIPSLCGFWSGVQYQDYYSQPWEYIADFLGGVERTGYQYSENTESIAFIYWIFTLFP